MHPILLQPLKVNYFFAIKMSSLEDAIVAAKCEVDEGDALVIDRTKFASRKRGRISVITRGSDTLNVKDESKDVEISAEVAFWREKYESLRLVKSGAEEELEEQLQLVTEREGKLEKYANLLEQKIEILKDHIPLQSKDDLNEKLNGYRKKLCFFETMTSMTVKCDDSEIYICTIKNRLRKTATRFQIVLNDGDEKTVLLSETPDINYAPIANSNLLPEYLQSEISFESDMAPVLMGDILQSLYEDAM